MSKKILILGPVHDEYNFLKQDNKYPFLRYQAQQGWVDALEKLGNNVFIFRYTDSFLIPNNLRIYSSSFFNKHFPIFTSRLLRVANKLNLFYFENLVKNKKFKKIVEEIHPDIIIISGGLFGISKKTLVDIKKKLKIKIILLSGVNPNYGASAVEKNLLKEDFFNFIFVNDWGYGKNWKKIGAINVHVLPISSANPKINKKIKPNKTEIKKYNSDICFIGSLSYYRQNILVSLTKYNLKIWGYLPPGTKLISELNNFYYGEAYSNKMVKIYNSSKIALNIHEKDMKYGGNLKTFEIPACFTFQLVDNINPNWFKKDKEVIIYEDIDDLQLKVNYYLQNHKERIKIAKAGYKKVLSDHTYERHFKKLLQKIQ